MQVGSVNSNYALSNFSTVNPENYAKYINTSNSDKFVLNQPKKEVPKPSITRKIGTGIASAVYPGLGQFVNGQWLKAAGFAIGVPLASSAAFFIAGPTASFLVGMAFYLWNIHDAVKNA